MSEGKYFFDDIKREGILLFNTSRYELAEKRKLSPLEVQKMAQADFDQWLRVEINYSANIITPWIR